MEKLKRYDPELTQALAVFRNREIDDADRYEELAGMFEFDDGYPRDEAEELAKAVRLKRRQ